MSSKAPIRFVGVLLTPSLTSAVLCIGISSLILFISSLIYNAKTGFLYDIFFGSNSSTELIQSARSTVDAIFVTTFSNPALNKVIFFAFWCLIGLAVYLFFSGLGRTSAVISETAQRRHYLHAKKNQLDEQLGLRLIIYSMAILLSVLYLIFFLRTLLPFSIICGRIGLSDLSTLSSWLYLLAGFIVLCVSMHIFIVLTRLLLLRPRIYGGWDDVLTGELGHPHHLN